MRRSKKKHPEKNKAKGEKRNGKVKREDPLSLKHVARKFKPILPN